MFSSRSLKIVITLVVVLAGASILVYSSLADAQYYEHVNEVMAAPQKWVGKTLRVHGFVEPGSIHEHIVGQTTKRTFVLQYKGRRLEVKNQGPKPDTFKDLAEVVATGTIKKEHGDYVLYATKLTAKCPSKYKSDLRTHTAQASPPMQSMEEQSSASR